MSKRQSSSAAAMQTLRGRIIDGTYEPDSRLPSTTAIAEEFGIDRGSASRVLARLREAGLIITRPGSGSFVRSFKPIRRSFPGRMFSWRDGRAIQDADTGHRPRAVDVVISEVPAPSPIAEILAVKADAPAVMRSRRFLVEERPVQLARSYYLPDMVRGTGIVYTDTGPGGAYARLAEIGHEPVEFTETLRARMPSPEETDRLELPGGTPVVVILRAAYAAEGRCVEVTEMVLDGSAYELEYSSVLS